MKTNGGVEVQLQAFLTSALVGGEWSASQFCLFTPAKTALSTQFIWDWVCPRDGLDAVEYREIFGPCQESNPGRSARRYTDWAIPVT
jgi:hypothetical protein